MSISATMKIKFNKSKSYSLLNIVKAFLEVGWKLKDKNGDISYLPLGDDDDFDWQSEMISETEVLKIIEKKEEANEWVGLIIYWEKTNIGITLLGTSADNVMLSFEVNRRRLNEEDITSLTDVNWYMDKIIVKLRNKQFQIESFIFEEY